MTVRCNGGTSSQRPGAGAQAVVAGAIITAALERLSPFLLPFAALFDGFLYEVNTQCPQDPPAMPVFDAGDMATLMVGTISPVWEQTADKVHALLLNYAWSLFCQCDAPNPTPALAPVQNPIGVSNVTASQSTPCFTGSAQLRPPRVDPGTPLVARDIYTSAVLPVDGRTLAINDARGTFTASGMPAAATSISYTSHAPDWPGSSAHLGFDLGTVYFLTNTGTAISNAPLQNINRTSRDSSGSIPVPATTSFWYASFQYHASSINGALLEDGIYSTQVFCGGQLGGYTDCCPPDPSIMIGINNILNAIANLSLGGDTSPTSWKDGVRHASLANAGSFPLADLTAIGVRVEVTTQPRTPHVLPGQPNFYWNMGFITPVALTSPLKGSRLVFLHQSFWLPPFTDTIGYTLLDGTVVDIVELLPVLPNAPP